jgi:K(+)-stimulated pyrophosphate-energized sodium pump
MRKRKPLPVSMLALLTLGFLFAATWLVTAPPAGAQQPPGPTAPVQVEPAPAAGDGARIIHLWEPLTSDSYALYEKILLILNVVVAFAGLGYAVMLVGQVKKADQGTPRMQEIARAVREGADAYLFRQFRVVGVLIVVITFGLFFAARSSASPENLANGNADMIAWGRAIAFLVGSVFSATVGFVGMRLATVGNLRVAAAARHSFGEALQLGYRTGTITGMLTDGLGLLGGSLIFLMYGEHAYEALLGFGFGGTLLALFMRVGGGIYTKAADVGADLVGKVEAGIPEDDPRNPATIADNVGDNVGDCAGMAADLFESYEVTLVASIILGVAAFNSIGANPALGLVFPLAARAIGVVASIAGVFAVKAKEGETNALKPINRGFLVAGILTVIGTFLIAMFYVGNDFANAGWKVFGAVVVGLVLAQVVSRLTEYFTATHHAPADPVVIYLDGNPLRIFSLLLPLPRQLLQPACRLCRTPSVVRLMVEYAVTTPHDNACEVIAEPGDIAADLGGFLSECLWDERRQPHRFRPHAVRASGGPASE